MIDLDVKGDIDIVRNAPKCLEIEDFNNSHNRLRDIPTGKLDAVVNDYLDRSEVKEDFDLMLIPDSCLLTCSLTSLSLEDICYTKTQTAAFSLARIGYQCGPFECYIPGFWRCG